MTNLEVIRSEYKALRALVIEFGEAGAREAASSYCLGVYLRGMQA